MDKTDNTIVTMYNNGWSRNQISKVLHVGNTRVQRTIRKYADRKSHLSHLKNKIDTRRKKARELQRIFGFSYNYAYKRIGERSFAGLYTLYNPHKRDEFLEGDRTFSP